MFQFKKMGKMKNSKPKLIFLYNSLSIGGGLTFLNKFKFLKNKYDIKFYSFKNIKQDNEIEFSRASINELFERDNTLVANSAFTALMIVILFYNKKRFYVTHGYANAFKHLSKIKKLTLIIVLFLGKNRITFIACGQDEENSILNLQPGIRKIKLIFNAIDPLTKQKWTQKINEKNFLFIGRLSHQKGLDILLDAMNFLDKNVSLTIAGPIQKSEKEFQNIINEKFIKLKEKGHNIEFIGPIDINTFNFNNYNCCILPSRYEGFAFLPLELSSLNIPYLLSECPGHHELITDELDKKYSFSIEKNYKLPNLINKIANIDQQKVYEDFKIINKKRLSMYSIEKFEKNYEKLFF